MTSFNMRPELTTLHSLENIISKVNIAVIIMDVISVLLMNTIITVLLLRRKAVNFVLCGKDTCHMKPCPRRGGGGYCYIWAI